MKPQLKEDKQQGTPLHPMQLYQMQAAAGRGRGAVGPGGRRRIKKVFGPSISHCI